MEYKTAVRSSTMSITKQYQDNAGKTDSNNYQPVVDRLNDDKIAKLIHYSFGLGTEAGELQDAVKKYIAYGKPLDVTNLKEEVGDLLWYIARICSLYGWDMQDVMDINIKKLKARYPEKFTEENAIVRDLNKERQILEQK
jgi:NTP pyrophosphatase (non-canonical NTP hydrolase)